MMVSKLAPGRVLMEMAVMIRAAYRRMKTKTDNSRPLFDVVPDFAEEIRCQTMGDMIQARVKDMVIIIFF